MSTPVEKKREKNRREMPNVAALVDEITRYFGPVRVLGAEDKVTGKKVGRLDDGTQDV